MWESIGTLFDGYGAIPMIIFAIGIIFCIIEIFVPDFGIFGILAIVFTIVGVVGRFLLDFDIQHLVLMVTFVLVVVLLGFMFMVYSAKNGLLGKSPIIERKTAISENYSKDNKEYLKLLGKTVFAETKFAPTGKFSYESNIYEATSYGEYIEKGTKIQIVEVSGNTIYVKKAK